MFKFRFRASSGWILVLDEGFFEGNSGAIGGEKAIVQGQKAPFEAEG